MGFVVAAFIVGFIVFDIVAVSLGADSRPTIGDDHQRSV